MGKKVYISPSSQPANVYAVGNTNEQDQCRKIGAALEKKLAALGFTAKAGLRGTMYTRVAESNAMGAALHLPIHTNACDGKVAGLRIMISKKGGEAEQVAKAIMNRLAPITPGTSDGISLRPALYEIKATKAPCVYVEVGFHDNKQEAKWIIEHTEDIAEAIAQGLCDHYGVTYTQTQTAQKTETASKSQEKTIYRVQVGAFQKKSYAQKLAEELKSKGYEALVVKKEVAS